MIIQNTYLTEFINEIDVECPNCGEHAVVFSDKSNRTNTRFICASCGKSKKWTGNASVYQTSGPEMDKTTAIALGKPFDCYFKFPLWFTCNFKGNIFFAYNLEHLKFQKIYIEDLVRKRTKSDDGWSNSSLESRLPKWILSANNREELLKKIAVLEGKHASNK